MNQGNAGLPSGSLIPLTAEMWAEVAARLQYVDRSRRAAILAAYGIDGDVWRRCDAHYAAIMIHELEDDTDEVSAIYRAKSLEEKARVPSSKLAAASPSRRNAGEGAGSSAEPELDGTRELAGGAVAEAELFARRPLPFRPGTSEVAVSEHDSHKPSQSGETVEVRQLDRAAFTTPFARLPTPQPSSERLTLEQHASLSAEISAFPAHEAAIVVRYGLRPEERLDSDRAWKTRLAASPELTREWQEKYEAYRSWLLRH